MTEKKVLAFFYHYVKERSNTMKLGVEDCFNRRITGCCPDEGIEVVMEGNYNVFLSLRRKTPGRIDVIEISGGELHASQLEEILKLEDLFRPLLEKMRDDIMRDQERAIADLFV